MDKEKVMELRNRTGAGMMDCKKALMECQDDIDVAYEYSRIMSQPVARFRKIDGQKVHWKRDDYLKEAQKLARGED